MSKTPKNELDDLLQSAEDNLRENRDELARADLLQAVEFAQKHFGSESIETNLALQPLMKFYYRHDEFRAGDECFQQIDHNLELRKTLTHERVQLYNDVAVILGKRDKSEDACKLLQDALVLAEKLGRQHRDIHVHALINMGYYYMSVSEYSKCIQFLERALEMGKSVKPYPYAKYANAARCLARAIFRSSGNLLEVISLLENALPVTNSEGRNPETELGLGYQILGIAYLKTQRVIQARYAFDKAANVFDLCGPEGKSFNVDNLAWMAENEIKLGNIDRAEHLLKKALEIKCEIHPEKHQEIINHKLQLIDFLVPRERYMEALPLLEEILATFDEGLCKDDACLQRQCNNLGFVYVHLERFPLAEKILRRAEKLSQQKTPPLPCPFITKNFGLMYQKMGYNEKAIVEYEKARQLFISQIGTQHPMIAFIDNALKECRENK